MKVDPISQSILSFLLYKHLHAEENYDMVFFILILLYSYLYFCVSLKVYNLIRVCSKLTIMGSINGGTKKD